MKLKNHFWRIFWILIIVGSAIWIVRPGSHNITIGPNTKKIELRRGLDLAGGSHLVYEVDLSQTKPEDKDSAVTGVIQTINRRINALGVAEPTIQEGKIGETRSVIVELPGVSNTQEAINLIGRTARLEFYEIDPGATEQNLESPASPIPGFKPTGLSGANLKEADIEFQNPRQTGIGRNATTISEPVVKIVFDEDGKNKFKEITARNLNQPVAIVIDNQVVSAPTVNAVIDGGEAIISGEFDAKSARELAITLKSGALPVPINLVQEQTIGATLGQDSIQKSLTAGVVGIFLVILFMILYYGIKGVFASVALILYTLIVIAVFKLIPITLTLAGIAGLILSIGAAVDANILIFERIQEEQKFGRKVQSAIDEGFKRAWSSIRDSNISSIITAIILIWLGTGIVKGFAVTLLIGILVSMFSAITISQTLLKLFLREPKLKTK